MSSRRQKQITIQLRADAESERGQIIEALQSEPLGKEGIVWQIAIAWYLPFTLSADDSNLRAVAIQCLGILEGRAQAIREYAGLLPTRAMTINASAIDPLLTTNDSFESHVCSGVHPEEELEEWELRQQKNLTMMDSLLGKIN
jgi:hypothetical protein